MNSTPRILFVDDDKNILAVIKRYFRDDGYEIIARTSPLDALNYLDTTKVDVIVSDFRMPEMDGAEFLKRAANQQPESVRVVLSGHNDLGQLVSAINEGSIYKFVGKPFEGNDLREAVKDAVSKHRSQQEMRALAEQALSISRELFHSGLADYSQLVELNLAMERELGLARIFRDVFETLPIPGVILNESLELVASNREWRTRKTQVGLSKTNMSLPRELPLTVMAQLKGRTHADRECKPIPDYVIADGVTYCLSCTRAADGRLLYAVMRLTQNDEHALLGDCTAASDTN